jgi:predicted XRE-type DNA-binding protein
MIVVSEKPEQPRKLVWLVDSLDRLTSFPPSVRQRLGFALYQAQIGQKHQSAKMLHGFAETVWQVRADDPGGTYRAGVCSTAWGSGLRASCLPEEGDFRNRDSTTRIGSDPAAAPTCSHAGREVRRMKMPNRESTPSSGNVFADLNLPQADDLLAKAELTSKIIAEIQRRRITQAQAAEILRIDQPKISALKQGKLSGFSVERLMRFLLLLGRDIEIAVKEKPRTRPTARLRVA